MNDFSEIENELKKLRPVQPSSEFFARVERALTDCRASVSDVGSSGRFIWWRWRFTETPYKIGFGLAAAAAVLLLLARIGTDRMAKQSESFAQISLPRETGRVVSQAEAPISANQFVPVGAIQVVYSTLDEGLRFVSGSAAPMRRLRYQTHETQQWRNPYTGESLRVSYPSEEIVLLPVSGQ